jgi:peptidoglycan/LPS O-acetylase OafA/YrhL
MLSGFIITRQYEAGIALRTIQFKTFAIQRLARMYPMYAFSMLLFLYANHYYIEPNEGINVALNMGAGLDKGVDILLQLTLLSNIGGMHMPWNGPAWSISVGWVMNLLFFWLAYRFRVVPTLLWFGMALFSLVYLLDYSSHNLNLTFSEQWLFNPTIARGLLGFSIGALIYRFQHFLPRLDMAVLWTLDVVVLALAVVICALYGMYSAAFPIGLDYVLVLVLFPALITISLYKDSMIGMLASMPLLRWLGKISFSMYLLCVPIGFLYQYSPFIQSLTLPRPVFGLVYVSVVVVVSVITYLAIEVPARRLGRRWTTPAKS